MADHPDDDCTARITELEARYTLQEDTLRQLSEVVWRQQQALDVLTKRVEVLEKRLRGIADTLDERPPDEPPPHY